MTSIAVGVRFHTGGKIYHFDAANFPAVKKNDFVIVDTSRGQQLGQVALTLGPKEITKDQNWKPIIRKATPRDLVLRQVWEEKEEEALATCHEKAKGLVPNKIKFVSAEYSLNGEKLVFLYDYEGNEDPDLGKLIRAIEKVYPDTEVTMRRIGPRDAAKIIGGMGVCGKEIRCCTEFMTNFQSISIKKAKIQGVSLVPSEITGMCGRLRCCLNHEHELYVEAQKRLPKRGKRVVTPQGEGKVVRLSPLQGTVMVNLGEAGYQEFSWDEIKQIKKK